MRGSIDVTPWNLSLFLIAMTACAPAGGDDTGGEGTGSGTAESGESGTSAGPQCVDDGDCASGYCLGGVCEDYGCVAPPGQLDFRCPGAECYYDQDCFEGSRCVGNTCVYDDDEPEPECPGASLFPATIAIPIGGEGVITSLAFTDVLPAAGVELVVHRGEAVMVANAESSTTVVQAVQPLLAASTGDIDGDGTIDLVTSNDDPSPGVQVWLGDTGVFVPGTTTPTLAARVLATGDIGGDGFDDVVFLSGTTIWSMPGDASGVLGEAVQLVDAGAERIVVADFDGDARADIAFAGAGVHAIFAAVGTAMELPGAPLSMPVGIDAADFNGDALLDLAVVTPDAPIIATWHGPVGETEASLLATDAIPTATAVGEVDGDGYADLVIARGDGTIEVQFGGFGVAPLFRCAQRYPQPHAATALAIGDIDGDGDADIVLTDGTQISALPQ